MSTILVVDDEQMIRLAFAEFLKDLGHTALLAEDGDCALARLQAHHPEIVFLDYRMPGADGLEILAQIRSMAPETAVIFMTAFGAMDVAIKAMQLGAHEYLTKPLDLDRIREIIERILADKKSMAELAAQPVLPEISVNQMVGNSPAMQEIYKMIGLLSTQEATVLITGESGVGKELVARAIHDNSPRSGQPFMAVNCGALPENLLESELFGYEQGAFTGASNRKTGRFEAAGRGTLFLDEIGELQLPLQVKLLRVLQERTFERVGGIEPLRAEARIIAATNKDLKEEMMAGRFRKDLFYRLSLVHLDVPPLRQRVEDIPALIDHFISRENQEQHRQVFGVTDTALRQLRQYPWPGNIRELENQIKRAMIMSRESLLTQELFDLDNSGRPGEPSTATSLIQLTRRLVDELSKQNTGLPIHEHILGLVEKTVIAEALQKCGGNQVHAAQMLAIHRSTLRNKIKDYRL